MVVHVTPHRRVEVAVPRGTAVSLELAKGRGTVEGADDVSVGGAKAQFDLRDLAGSVQLRCAKSTIDVGLAGNRETRAVDVAIAKTRLRLRLPAERGGRYDVQTAGSFVSTPASVADGIPVRIRAARASVVIRAA